MPSGLTETQPVLTQAKEPKEAATEAATEAAPEDDTYEEEEEEEEEDVEEEWGEEENEEEEDYWDLGYASQAPKTMSILVKLISKKGRITGPGKPMTVRVNEHDTIKAVKEEIKRTCGLPIHQQRLMADGRKLQEKYTLKYYHIKNRSAVDVVYS